MKRPPHTPAPWIVKQDAASATYITSPTRQIVAAGGLWECENDPTLEEEANARLIAAAPDLLAALDYLLAQTIDMDLKYGIELTEGETEAREMALAAIAKTVA